MKPLRILSYAELALPALGSPVSKFFAQENFGAIRGTILDATGAAIGGANAVITSENTGAEKTLATSDGGFYSVDALTPGPYSVKITYDGFSQVIVQHVQANLGQTRETSVTLKVGNTGESISVTAALAEAGRQGCRIGPTWLRSMGRPTSTGRML